MPGLDQEVDAIIAEEGLTNDNSATEEPVAIDNTTNTPIVEDDNKPVEPPVVDDKDDVVDKPDIPPTEPVVESSITDTPDTSATETVQEAKTFLDNLNLSIDDVVQQDGSIKPFEDVIPAGQYLVSQLTPVKVVDDTGKTHEFLLLDDVEKAFPDGFKAKNNIEQLKFEKGIMANEQAFDNAVKTYNGAKETYTKETSAIAQAQSDNARLRSEYTAMADAGLVPKIDGDPNDPKFLESAAVKELNAILNYMETKNKELSSKGLGTVTSLYVAKQLMQIEGEKVQKDDKKQSIINERKEVASLTNAPSSTDINKPKPNNNNIPLSRLADMIIQEEGLR
jgi:hypothetical protein